jgi:hypothetical protein
MLQRRSLYANIMQTGQNRSAGCWVSRFSVSMLRAIGLKSLTLFLGIYRKSRFWFPPCHLLFLVYSSYMRRIFRMFDILVSLELRIRSSLPTIEWFLCFRKEFSSWINTLLPPITVKVWMCVSIDVNVYIYVNIYRFA